MKRIIIPSHHIKRSVPFYLSVEEWVAGHLPAGEYFFAWQVAPSVICGRHQEIDREVDLDYAEKASIEVWRRKSGGGAVFADYNNVMFSYICPSEAVKDSFESYTSKVCEMLATFNLTATPTGRNDIAIDGCKVAGNAFLRLPGRNIVHGTMLFDTDFEAMQRVLTPDRAKTLSKGVKSVHSRVTTLKKAGIKVDCGTFIERAQEFLSQNDGSYELTEADMAEVLEIEKSYHNPSFLNRRPERHDDTKEASGYFDGVGFVRANFKAGAPVALSGDFLKEEDITPEIIADLAVLAGVDK